MDPEKIDFSPLDPAKDAARWEQLVQRISAHAVAEPPVHPISNDLIRWSRALIAVAAVAVLAAWLPALLRAEESPATQTLSASTLAEWASQGEVPGNVDLYGATTGTTDGE